MKRIACGMVLWLAAVCLAPAWAPAEEKAEAPKRRIELAICLDTSGSMSGLINAARQKLWDIVNELALAKPEPDLRVALLSYGHGDHAESGHILMQTGLTDDLDTVYQKLMALQITGSNEYVGWVVNDAATKLEWSDAKDALKIIFVAGNESADQAREKYDYRKVCADAIAKGIVVNSIYCGNPTDNIAPGWQEVAKLADGHFAAIDQNNGVITISTPFDDKIAALNAKLNETYVPYGPNGQIGAANQVAQDANSVSQGSANIAARAVTKAQSFYSNGSWDLVDARNGKDFDIEKVKKEDLPENMQKMNVEEQKAYLDKMQAQRASVQTEINGLATQRRQYIEAEQKKMAAKGQNSLDEAMTTAIREQAEKAEFKFEEKY